MPLNRVNLQKYGIRLPSSVIRKFNGRRVDVAALLREYIRLGGKAVMVPPRYIPKAPGVVVRTPGVIYEPPSQPTSIAPVVQQVQQKIPPKQRIQVFRKPPVVRGADSMFTISQYAKAKRTVAIGYRRSTEPQIFKWYEIEPYAIRYRDTLNHGRRSYLYGFEGGRIKSFIIANIQVVDATRSRPFSPRWPVEF